VVDRAVAQTGVFSMFMRAHVEGQAVLALKLDERMDALWAVESKRGICRSRMPRRNAWGICTCALRPGVRVCARHLYLDLYLCLYRQ